MAQESSYLAARREWNERYGDYLVTANRWRLTAFASLVIAAICASGMVYLSATHTWIPYVVEIDSTGEVVRAGPAQEMREIPRRLIRFSIAQFIQDVRSVSLDAAVQRRAVKRAFAHMGEGQPAHKAVSEFFRNHDPFQRAATATVVVEIEQVLPLSPETWRIEWVERSRARSGEAHAATHWVGTANVVSGEVDPTAVLLNPAGVFIREFTWAQDFTPSSE